MAPKYPSDTWDAQLSMNVLNYARKQMETHPSPQLVQSIHIQPSPPSLILHGVNSESISMSEQQGNWTRPNQAMDPHTCTGGDLMEERVITLLHANDGTFPPRLQLLAI